MSALFQGVAGRTVDGSVFATLGVTPPDHYANGLPYEANGSLCFESGNITHYHQGLPFTVNNRIATAATDPARFNSGAMPISGNGNLSVSISEGADHFSSGVGYNPNGRVDYEVPI
jgi:hypothetical protein